MANTGINAILGIIPICVDEYDFKNFSHINEPIDHSAPYGKDLKGNPKNKSCKSHHFSPCPKCVFGPSIIPGLSVAKLPLTGKLVIPAEFSGTDKSANRKETSPERVFEYEIISGIEVWINGVPIASAPNKHDNGRTVTPAQKLTFCKAVIWQLSNDEGSLKDQIAKMDLPIQAPANSEPEISIESITGSPYPGPGVLDEYRFHGPVMAYDMDKKDLSKTLEELRDYDQHDDIGDHHESDNALLEVYWPGVFAECYQAFVPVETKPAGLWYPQYRCYIQEVPA